MFNTSSLKILLAALPLLLVACGDSANQNSNNTSTNSTNNNVPSSSQTRSDAIPVDALETTTQSGTLAAKGGTAFKSSEALLAPPRGIHFDVKGDTVSFRWPDVTDAIGYKILRGDGEQLNSYATSFDVGEPAFSDSGLELGKVYFYQFISTGDQGESIASATYKISMKSTTQNQQRAGQQEFPK